MESASSFTLNLTYPILAIFAIPLLFSTGASYANLENIVLIVLVIFDAVAFAIMLFVLIIKNSKLFSLNIITRSPKFFTRNRMIMIGIVVAIAMSAFYQELSAAPFYVFATVMVISLSGLIRIYSKPVDRS